MKRVARIALSFALLASISLGAQAPTQKPAPAATPAPSVAGKWTMALETPHGKITATFDLKVDGKKVTGTFATDHNDKVGLEGEFANNKLTFKTTEGGLTVTAMMKDADTLNAVVSSERGDLMGIAKREKGKS